MFPSNLISIASSIDFGIPFSLLEKKGCYRYGFNGMEKDDEVKGEGNSYDFGARMHDPRIGRFFAIDPRVKDFPFMSPYCFAANNPIAYIDVNGEGPGRKKPKTMPVLTKFNASEVANNALVKVKTTGLTPSAEGVTMTISFEDLSLSMYDLDGDPRGNATIGFGHKIHDNAIDGSASETEFKDGITIDKATELLAKDIESINGVLQNRVKNRGMSETMTQSEYDVAFDMEYNTGSAGKYLDKLNKVKRHESTGNAKKENRARDKLTNWLSRQYPGNDKKRGTARAFLNEGTYSTKRGIIEEVMVVGKKSK